MNENLHFDNLRREVDNLHLNQQKALAFIIRRFVVAQLKPHPIGAGQIVGVISHAAGSAPAQMGMALSDFVLVHL
jgi:hypothetical protein